MQQDDLSDPFEPAESGQLVLDLEGFEGPIDVLLTLAREQKVDLIHISILALADQYLAFVASARRMRLEIAADYLVMAAWLAYLKSRLLLPQPPGDEEPSGAELAAALTFQMQRLEAMQEAGARLWARPRLGADVFPRGAPEGITVVTNARFDVSLFELLSAYGDQERRKREAGPLRVVPLELYSMDDALQRLKRLLGDMPDWTTLASFLPEHIVDPLVRRSALAATLAASLEMARDGKLLIRQDDQFGPIFLRPKS